jgi:GTP pyrophosphokinase
MLEWQKETQDPREFMESLRIDLYADRVFVFTPKGDVINLPAGATPIDFAYAIHTEVGHRCAGAKVNGRLVPLDYRLNTGDTVDILTAKGRDGGPSQDWLKLVVSPRARAKIKQWFSRERREDAIDTGRELLDRELRRQGLPLKRLTTEETLTAVAAELKYPSLDGLLAAIGDGHVSPQSVVVRLTRSLSEATEEEGAGDVPPARPVHLAPRSGEPAVMVQGASDVWVSLSRCCTPVPGDEILGFVTRGKGVSVHRVDCPNAKGLGTDRLIEVSWRPGKSTLFTVSIQAEALDRKKLLGDVATALSEQQVNILVATSNVGKDRVARLRFTFELGDITHLASVLQAVKKVDGVFDAYRVVPG